MTLESALLLVGAYLLGSIPTAYIVAHWMRGIDLRRYGSGTVSGSMVFEHVARWAVLPVALFDIFKAALPTWLGLRLGLGPEVAAAAGLAAVAGHNWPVFLHFAGGRGLSTFGGMLLVLYPWGCAWMLALVALGFALGDSAPWALASMATLPLFAHFVGGPELIVPLAGGMVLLTLAKRLEANRRPLPPPGPERRKVIVRRLLLDRDIASHQAWIHRRPEEGGGAGAG
jgi:glycerol-3-phosphate acyltransferase PlsY